MKNHISGNFFVPSALFYGKSTAVSKLMHSKQ